MKRLCPRASKAIIASVVSAILLLCMSGEVYSSGWFTFSASLANSSAPFYMCSLGNDSTLDFIYCENQSQYDEYLSLFIDSIQPEMYDAAESSFKNAVYESNFTFGFGGAEPQDVDSGYRIVKLEYTFRYTNYEANPANVYVRFIPGSNYANVISLNGLNDFCLQTLAYAEGSGTLTELPRVDFAEGDSAYYYDKPLYPDDEIALVYTLLIRTEFLSNINFNEILSFETIQANNNVSVAEWNITIEGAPDYGLRVFDRTLCLENNYLYVLIEGTGFSANQDGTDGESDDEPETGSNNESETGGNNDSELEGGISVESDSDNDSGSETGGDNEPAAGENDDTEFDGDNESAEA